MLFSIEVKRCQLTTLCLCPPPPPLGCDGGFLYTVGGLKDGGSIMTIEQRLDQLEKRNKRLTVALTMTANKRLTAALTVMAVILATGCGSKGVTSESDGLPSTLVGNWAFSRDGNYQGRAEYNEDLNLMRPQESSSTAVSSFSVTFK